MKIMLVILFTFIAHITNAQENSILVDDELLKFVNLFDAGSSDRVSCYRIPSIVTAPNGDIIVAIDERVPSCDDLRSNKDINIVIRRSSDNGTNWSEIETLVDYPFGQSASDPSMIADQITGEIFLFFNYMDLENEKDIYYHKMIRSKDNGLTWSEPTDLTSQITFSDWHNDFKFITSGRGLQTKDGKLLHTLVNLNRGLFVFGSDDHGANWFLVDTPITPADESKMAELNDGTWMINSRVNKLGYRVVHTSTDQGKNWISRVDSALVDPGCNASLIYCQMPQNSTGKNLLLFSNAKMQNERSRLTISISNDEGHSWFAEKTIYTGSSAYSSMTILKNGDIGLFFEKDGYSENAFVRIPLKLLIEK